jgi:hypothetical protein
MKWNIYDEQISQILYENPKILNTKVAQKILNINISSQFSKEVEVFRKYISRNRTRLIDEHEGIYNATNELDVPNTSVKHLWLKTKKSSIFVKNPNFVENSENDLELIKIELLKELQNYVPKYPTIKRKENNENKRLFVFDPADIHIGKLCSAFEVGETYNNQIAVQRVLKGCKGILNEIKENSIDKILFVIGNDILHIDNTKRTTTSGTPQDTDGMWHTNFLIAKQLYVDIVEILLQMFT